MQTLQTNLFRKSFSRNNLLKFLKVFMGVLFFIYFVLVIYVSIGVFRKDQLVTADAILILGAKAYKGNQYNPCLVARVEEGIALYNKKYAPLILVSGGDDGEDQRNEAETMRDIVTISGIPQKSIILENHSTSTYENLLNSKELFPQYAIKKVILVTEPFHIARASLIAQKLGILHQVDHAVNSPCWTRWKFLSRYFLKEPLGILYYKLTNKL